MRLRYRLLPLAAALAVAISACGDGGPERLTLEDNESSIEISVGDTFEVILEGNPTTGFTWVVESGDSAIIEVTGEPVFEPETGTDGQVVGAGGEFTFEFEGKSPGTTTLELVYRRTFETVPPEDTFTVTVTVE